MVESVETTEIELVEVLNTEGRRPQCFVYSLGCRSGCPPFQHLFPPLSFFRKLPLQGDNNYFHRHSSSSPGNFEVQPDVIVAPRLLLLNTLLKVLTKVQLK